MIAGCIDKMREGACADCARRDDCAALFRWLRPEKARPRWSPRPRPGASPAGGGPSFLSFLTVVASAVDGWANERRVARDKAERAGADGAASTAAVRPQPGRFCRMVEQTVEPLLASGEVRIAAIARTLGVSRQTLYRRLKAEGTTFERLLDGLRHRLASRLLGEGVAVKDIAYRLGFSDPAAFSRAFKRWTGASPTTSR